MADRFYSVVKGEGLAHQVTEGAATSGEAIELRINDSITSRLDALLALKAFETYLTTTETDPIA